MDFSSSRSFGSNSVGHDNFEDTWESLDNIKGSNPRILENFLAKHDIAQELAAKQAEITRDQRRATAQAVEQAARTRASLKGIGGPAPLFLLASQGLSRSRNGTASSWSAGAAALDETTSGDHTDGEGNQATFPLI
jgi:hypothetical protein